MITNPHLAPARTFEDLVVWQKAHQFVLAVYQMTENFPQKEVYGLTSQFRRAAVSIAANIAEGFKKVGRMDKLRFLNTAQRSLEECRDFLILTRDLGYADTASPRPVLEERSKLLEAYSGAIRRRLAANACGIVLGLSSILICVSFLLK